MTNWPVDGQTSFHQITLTWYCINIGSIHVQLSALWYKYMCSWFASAINQFTSLKIRHIQWIPKTDPAYEIIEVSRNLWKSIQAHTQDRNFIGWIAWLRNDHITWANNGRGFIILMFCAIIMKIFVSMPREDNPLVTRRKYLHFSYECERSLLWWNCIPQAITIDSPQFLPQIRWKPVPWHSARHRSPSEGLVKPVPWVCSSQAGIGHLVKPVPWQSARHRAQSEISESHTTLQFHTAKRISV